MTLPSMSERVETLVAGWNKATGLNLNPRAFERELFAVASDPTRYPSDCLEVLAKWVKSENAKASEPRFKRKLDLTRFLDPFSKFDSEYNLAAAWWRNIPKKTDRASVLQAAGRTDERMSTRTGVDLIKQSLDQFSKQ